MKLPAGWVLCRIDELGEVMGGRQRSCKIIRGQPIPYLRVANVMDGWIDTTDVLRMPFTEAEIQRYRLLPGDILLNEGQSLELVGRSAVYRGELPVCCFQNTLIRFRPNQKTAGGFAQGLFRWLASKGRFAAIASRTTSIAHLGVKRLASMRVACPQTRTEQHSIGEVLSGFDTVSQLLKHLSAAKRRFKRGLMQDVLTGRRRFKEFDSKPWQVRRLGDLFDERVESDRPDLPLLSITAHRGVIPRDEVDRKDTSNADKSKYLRIARGDIGYNTMRMWQGVSALSAYEGIVSPAYTICAPKPSIHPAFAAYLFKLPALIDLFRRHSQGLVNDTLNLKYPHFARIEVLLPDLNEQQTVADVLEALDLEIDLLERQRDALDRQHRAVAELLLTGRIRIPA